MSPTENPALTPRRFSEIVGNQRLIRILRQSRVPQSALFIGPDGIGKRTVALLMAALANCHNPEGNDLCGACPACVKALSGFHPDIRQIPQEEPANSVGIDEIRNLNREAQFLPFEGRERVFLIDRAERMTPEAQNALLKTLEEPPATTHLVLVSAFPQRLLPTIRSRCQSIQFRPLSVTEIEAFLRKRSDLRRPDLRASFAAGSLSLALDMDLDALLERRDLVLELLVEWLEDDSFETVFNHTERKEWAGLLRKREEVTQLLETLQSLCYDIYFCLSGTPRRVVNLDRAEEIGDLAAKISDSSRLRPLLESIVAAKQDVDRYVNPQMCFETLWLLGRHSTRNPGF